MNMYLSGLGLEDFISSSGEQKAVVSGLGATKNAADRIRALTDPARAKVVMDSAIKFVREENAAKAKQISAYIMQRSSKKPGMGYLSYSWWNPLHVARGTPISDLEKYTEANRQLIFRYLRNSDPAVIEYSFTQKALDGALVNAKAGERLPATVPVLKDPVKVAVDTFTAGVKQDIVNAPANVVAVAQKVAAIVGEAVVGKPQQTAADITTSERAIAAEKAAVAQQAQRAAILSLATRELNVIDVPKDVQPWYKRTGVLAGIIGAVAAVGITGVWLVRK
jgi:hypothetical protein